MEQLTELLYAAEHGSTEAMYELGMMYYSGDGVAEDEREAMKAVMYIILIIYILTMME